MFGANRSANIHTKKTIL